MEGKRKLLVGFDLSEEFSQISCFSYKTLEPVSICPNEKEENGFIPTVLYLRGDTDVWLYGNEAIAAAAADQKEPIVSLLTKICAGEEIRVYEKSYTPVALLEKFLRKTLMLIKNYFPTEPITRIVITIQTMETKLVEGIYEALELLGILKDRATVISHESSYLSYVVNQDKSLWLNDVGLFDFDEEGLLYSQIKVNRKTQPFIAGISQTAYADTIRYDMKKEQPDQLKYAFEQFTKTVLYKQVVSTLYFTGTGFEGNWAESVIKSLCAGRRVFMGQNLYTKGACYAAKDMAGEGKKDVAVLGEEMITNTVTLQVYQDTAIREFPLIEALVPWYEVNRSVEVILDDATELNIMKRNIFNGDVVEHNLTLNPRLHRKNRMTRLKLSITCKDTKKAKINIMDLGFGEFEPGTNRDYEYMIEI
ncbi:MAG: hypothetical protein K0S47_2110 [Herbinix sp.]|jgi:hypothetical protein|nr:hypothetical protein [Herbinix sp.]